MSANDPPRRFPLQGQTRPKQGKRRFLYSDTKVGSPTDLPTQDLSLGEEEHRLVCILRSRSPSIKGTTNSHSLSAPSWKKVKVYPKNEGFGTDWPAFLGSYFGLAFVLTKHGGEMDQNEGFLPDSCSLVTQWYFNW